MDDCATVVAAVWTEVEVENTLTLMTRKRNREIVCMYVLYVCVCARERDNESFLFFFSCPIRSASPASYTKNPIVLELLPTFPPTSLATTTLRLNSKTNDEDAPQTSVQKTAQIRNLKKINK